VLVQFLSEKIRLNRSLRLTGSILFIIFDLEAMFLFPWVVSVKFVSSVGFWVMVDFLIELTVGFVYAWKIGALEWE
jgi:NADH-quinone oxidoreductase subunit A